MNQTDNSFWPYFAALFLGGMVWLATWDWLRTRQARPPLEYDKSTPLPARQPRPPQKACAAAWYLRPLYSRGEYSPRLTMAWLVTLFALWVVRHWITTAPQMLNGILVQPPSVTELVGILLGFSGLLLGLGTLQKVKLDGPPPQPDTQIVADSAPVSGQNITVTPKE